MEQRFFVPVHAGYDGDYILQIALSCDGLLEVVGVAPLHAVLVGGIANDLLFLNRSDMTGVNL